MAFVSGKSGNPNGRPKGSRNKKDLMVEQLTQQAIDSGITPLDFFLTLLRDDAMPLGVRFECAKAAAPYCHRKKPIEVEVTNPEFKVLDMSALSGLSDVELELLEKLMDKAARADASRLPAKLDPRVVADVGPGGARRASLPAPAPKPKPKGRT